jgi:AAA domain
MSKFHLTRFCDIAITEGVAYLVKDLIPTMGLVVVWGPPKCGKSFWMFDLAMHIALGGRMEPRLPFLIFLETEINCVQRRRVC